MLFLLFLALRLSLIRGVTVSCNYKSTSYFEEFQAISLINKGYQCDGGFSTDCDKEMLVVGVSTNHRTGKTLKDVKLLLFINKHITRLPRGLDWFFPEILALRLPNNGLEEISSEDLKYTKLEFLYLGGNELEYLPAGLFKHVPKLEFLGLNDNPITVFGADILKPLQSLKFGYFWRISCLKNFRFHAKVSFSRSELDILATFISEHCEPLGNEIDPDYDEMDLFNDQQKRVISDSCDAKYTFESIKTPKIEDNGWYWRKGVNETDDLKTSE